MDCIYEIMHTRVTVYYLLRFLYLQLYKNLYKVYLNYYLQNNNQLVCIQAAFRINILNEMGCLK